MRRLTNNGFDCNTGALILILIFRTLLCNFNPFFNFDEQLEPMTTSSDGQLVTASAQAGPGPTWGQPSPPQFMPLSPTQQQNRPQMDVLLSQQEYQQRRASPQPMSQCSPQPEFLIPNIPTDIQKPMSSTLSTLMPVLQNGQSFQMDTSSGYESEDQNSNQMNNNETTAQEVLDRFDSLGLDIDTSELLADMNFNSATMMSALMESTSLSIGNSRENLLNSRDNILVSSSLQTPDVQTSGGPDENSRNLMANPQQMQRLQTKLIQLESNNNITNNMVVSNAANDKINNN